MFFHVPNFGIPGIDTAPRYEILEVVEPAQKVGAAKICASVRFPAQPPKFTIQFRKVSKYNFQKNAKYVDTWHYLQIICEILRKLKFARLSPQI